MMTISIVFELIKSSENNTQEHSIECCVSWWSSTWWSHNNFKQCVIYHVHAINISCHTSDGDLNKKCVIQWWWCVMKILWWCQQWTKKPVKKITIKPLKWHKLVWNIRLAIQRLIFDAELISNILKWKYWQFHPFHSEHPESGQCRRIIPNKHLLIDNNTK